MLNTFSGIGRLSSDPQVTKDNGTVTTRFEIGINEFFRQGNDLKKKTHWVPCLCYDRLAEIAGEFLTKGSQVGIRGPLKSNEWTDANGKHKNGLAVFVTELEFLSSRLADESTN
ncbi:single-stranded DNA-binding protein [bacterium]|nr:single-stranded DNA-binding protein [bacterium]